MEVRERSSMDASLGISRRTLLRRGAVVGGALAWTVPVVSTLAAPSAAAGTPADGLSFVAILVECQGKWYRMKWEVDGSMLSLDTGPNFQIPGGPSLLNGQTIESGAAPGVTAVLNANGSLTVSLGMCVLQDFVVKRGECNATPGIAGQPGVPQSGTVTFPVPTSHLAGCAIA